MRTYRTGLAYIMARCLQCDFWLDSANAHGLAVQHHDRTGHQVAVEYTRTILYGDDPTSEKPKDGKGRRKAAT